MKWNLVAVVAWEHAGETFARFVTGLAEATDLDEALEHAESLDLDLQAEEYLLNWWAWPVQTDLIEIKPSKIGSSPKA